MNFCHCIMGGTKACEGCSNNPGNKDFMHPSPYIAPVISENARITISDTTENIVYPKVNNLSIIYSGSVSGGLR